MPPPLDKLNYAYEERQMRRVEATRFRLANQTSSLANGRVIPDAADLPIGTGRRMQAAVLFLDISGFTRRRSETASEQDTQVRVLSLFFSEMIRIVGDFGGTVEKNTGDGIMAYFSRGDGSGEQVERRAVICAVYMFHAVTKFINPIIRNSGFEELSFRVCIEWGWVTIARLGAARRFNHIVAVGGVANRASKMLSYAEPGELLLGEALLHGLPLRWLEDHVRLKTDETGWSYHDGRPYGFWTFGGRWVV